MSLFVKEIYVMSLEDDSTMMALEKMSLLMSIHIDNKYY
jgi:hypothetical protein